jgi:hypothetical protein
MKDSYARTAPRIAFGVFLVLHGIAHAPGMLGAWKLATFENVSYQPNLILTDASDRVVYLLGALWLIAGLGVIAAGVSTILGKPWWTSAVAIATLVSIIPCTLWREDAVVGLAIDVAVLMVIAGLLALSALTRGRVGHGFGRSHAPTVPEPVLGADRAPCHRVIGRQAAWAAARAARPSLSSAGGRSCPLLSRDAEHRREAAVDVVVGGGPR